MGIVVLGAAWLPLAMVGANSFTDGQAADRVIGQPDFNSTSFGTTASTLSFPFAVAVDPTTGKVFVADTHNNRVLRFAAFASLSNGAAAEGVLGQTDFTTSGSAITQSSLHSPASVAVDSAGRLWVADLANHRVLRFDNAAGKANGANADGVIGQTTFTGNTAAAGATGLNNPTQVAVDAADNLWVADQSNQRVLHYTGAPDPVSTPTATATSSPGLGNLRFIPPVRVVDTRGGAFGPIGYTGSGAALTAGQLSPGSITRFKLAGQSFGSASLPADASGVLINVTLVQASAAGGFLTVYPGDAASPPNASTVNPSTATAANFWAVGLPTTGANAGTIAVNSVGDPRDVVIDLVGFYARSNPAGPGNLRFISPVRVLDTRPAQASGNPSTPIGFQGGGCAALPAGRLPAGAITHVQLNGCTFGSTTFPADTSGVLAHLTTVQEGPSGGFTTLLPGDVTGVPNTSTVNPNTGIDFNAWAMGVPTSGPGVGQLGLYSTNSQDVAIDIVGYFAPSNTVGQPGVVGNLTLVTPARVVDTRPAPLGPIGYQPNGTPVAAGQLASGTTTRFLLDGKTFGGGSLTVPGDAKGVLVNATISQASPAGGFLTVFPGSDAAAPNTSTVNPNTAIAASFWASGINPTGATFPGTLGVYSTGDPRSQGGAAGLLVPAPGAGAALAAHPAATSVAVPSLRADFSPPTPMARYFRAFHQSAE